MRLRRDAENSRILFTLVHSAARAYEAVSPLDERHGHTAEAIDPLGATPR